MAAVPSLWRCLAGPDRNCCFLIRSEPDPGGGDYGSKRESKSSCFERKGVFSVLRGVFERYVPSQTTLTVIWFGFTGPVRSRELDLVILWVLSNLRYVGQIPWVTAVTGMKRWAERVCVSGAKLAPFHGNSSHGLSNDEKLKRKACYTKVSLGDIWMITSQRRIIIVIKHRIHFDLAILKFCASFKRIVTFQFQWGEGGWRPHAETCIWNIGCGESLSAGDSLSSDWQQREPGCAKLSDDWSLMEWHPLQALSVVTYPPFGYISVQTR